MWQDEKNERDGKKERICVRIGRAKNGEKEGVCVVVG